MAGRRLTQRQQEQILRVQERRRDRAGQRLELEDDAGLGPGQTGLVIAHHLESLSQIMNLARTAEKAAKGVPGKDALAITLSKRSGIDRTIAGHWSTLAPMFDQLTRLVQETGFQPRSLLAYLDRCLDTSDAVPIPQQMQWDYK